MDLKQTKCIHVVGFQMQNEINFSVRKVILQSFRSDQQGLCATF